MNHKGTILLETNRLILRKFVIEDSEDMYHNWASEDEVAKFLTWPTHSDVEVTRALLSSWIANYNPVFDSCQDVKMLQSLEL